MCELCALRRRRRSLGGCCSTRLKALTWFARSTSSWRRRFCSLKTAPVGIWHLDRPELAQKATDEFGGRQMHLRRIWHLRQPALRLLSASSTTTSSSCRDSLPHFDRLEMILSARTETSNSRSRSTGRRVRVQFPFRSGSINRSAGDRTAEEQPAAAASLT